MAVEPKKKKLRPNERFVWGPGVGPEGIFGGEKKLDKMQWWTVAFFQHFFGGMEMPTNCEQLEKIYFVFSPWWTQQVRKYNDFWVDENPLKKKLW